MLSVLGEFSQCPLPAVVNKDSLLTFFVLFIKEHKKHKKSAKAKKAKNTFFSFFLDKARKKCYVLHGKAAIGVPTVSFFFQKLSHVRWALSWTTLEVD